MVAKSKEIQERMHREESDAEKAKRYRAEGANGADPAEEPGEF